MDNILQKFSTAMSEAGLNFSASSIISDGAIHRFKQVDDKGEPCWYVLHIIGTDIAYGAFGCHKRDIKGSYCSKDSKQLTSEEKATIADANKQFQQKLEAEKKVYHAKAAKNATELWNKTSIADNDHPYLLSRNVKNYGLRLMGNSLAIPLLDNEDCIHGLQFITPDGTKKFLTGTNKKGRYFPIKGTIDNVIVGEGFATMASIHEATGFTTIIAFDAGNLLLVVQAIAKKYPLSQIIIAADNDAYSKRNVGVEKATDAAQSINAKLAIPQFKDTSSKPSDFNDLMQLEGLAEIKRQLDNADYVKDDEEQKHKPAQSGKLLNLVENIELFCDKQGVAYASFENKGHRETWAIESSKFQDWLSACYWKKYNKAPNRSALQDVLNVISGKARFDNSCQNVHMRVAHVGSTIYVDLCNENWEIVKVTPYGWNILKASPIKFKRTSNMSALPTPKTGGNINDLWQFLNIPQQSRKLILAFLLECLRPDTPFPILVLHGLQGSAKSTTQEILRKFIDPSSNNLRSAPKKSEDLLVAAVNNWVVSFNNVSRLSDSQQDELCSLSTGGGFGTRELYTTNQEAVVDVKRPVIINGICDFVTAPDLIDRCLIIELPHIRDNQRKTETEIQNTFEKIYPELFGALLNVLVATLKELPNIRLEDKPRMADFAMLGSALEKVQNWGNGLFLNEYEANRRENVLAAMEYSPVVLAIINFMQLRQRYEGTFSQLYGILNEYKPAMCGWPQSSKGLANQIKRHIYALKLVNLDIKFGNRQKDGYYIYIYKVENKVHQVHQVHQPSNSNGSGGELMGELRDSDVHKYTTSTPYVHPVSYCKDRENVLGVLGEHRNVYCLSDKKEVAES
jgi:phage/plasmid primase-like uncharacterized protein